MKVLGSYILLEPHIKTKSKGLLLPESSINESQIGVVKEKSDYVDCVEVGEKIFYNRYAGKILKLEEEEYLLIKDNEILGVIR